MRRPSTGVIEIILRNNVQMEVRSDPFESAKSHFFDTSSWDDFCDITLTTSPTAAVG